jgi:hypothetical protein
LDNVKVLQVIPIISGMISGICTLAILIKLFYNYIHIKKLYNQSWFIIVPIWIVVLLFDALIAVGFVVAFYFLTDWVQYIVLSLQSIRRCY